MGSTLRRSLLAALALALAAPAGAYLPPARAILKRVAQRRADLGLASLEVRGSVLLSGEAAERVAALLGRPAGGDLRIPAVFLLKAPGRCRLELAPEGVAPAGRPAVSLRPGHAGGNGGLEAVPAARALVEGVCALLAERRGAAAEPERPLTQALAARGVALGDVALGRMEGRVAWVIGGRPQEDKPEAWVDKATFQPIRLVAPLGGAMRDVRLVDFGSAAGGDGFPRLVEVWRAGRAEAQLATEKVTPNPRLPDAVF